MKRKKPKILFMVKLFFKNRSKDFPSQGKA